MEIEEARLELRRKFCALPASERQACWPRVQKHLHCEVCKRWNCVDGGYVTDYKDEVHVIMCRFCVLPCVAVLADVV